MESLKAAIQERVSRIYPSVHFQTVSGYATYVGMSRPISVRTLIDKVNNLPIQTKIRASISPDPDGRVFLNVVPVGMELYAVGEVVDQYGKYMVGVEVFFSVSNPAVGSITQLSTITRDGGASFGKAIIPLTAKGIGETKIYVKSGDVEGSISLKVSDIKHTVIVPNVLDMLLSKASKTLTDSHLKYNIINWNLGIVDHRDSYKVVSQDPQAGESVEENYTVWLTIAVATEGTGGIGGLKIYNKSIHPSLDVFVWDSKTNSWNKKGKLDANDEMTILFKSNVIYTVEAFVPNKMPPNNRPYWEQNGIRGDSNGQELLYEIY